MFFLISLKTEIVRSVTRTKITRAPCRRRNGEAVPRAEEFGDLITADHKVLSDNCESRNSHRYAVVVQDLATQWIQAHPCKTKTSQETQRSLQKFLEPDRKPKVIYTDNSLEFGKACEDLSWKHCTSTPHRSETHGIAERAVRRVKEGTSAVLLQSGLNENWWADSMECYTYLRNVTDLLSDGKTPYERRFGQPFKGPIIPFGSLVEYHPITAKDQSRIHQLGEKVLPGLLLGYALYAEGIWKGDVLVADLEELETMDASEIYSKRINAKEVIFREEQGEFIFPIADGRIKPLGGDQDLRTPTLVRHRPIQGESVDVYQCDDTIFSSRFEPEDCMRTFSQSEPTRLLSSLQGASISQQHRRRCHRIQVPYHQYPQVPTVSLVPCPTLLNTVPTHFTHDETQRVATKPDFLNTPLGHDDCNVFRLSGMSSFR